MVELLPLEDYDDLRFRSPGVMRKGHCRRLAREGDKESTRGRARYSRSVGKFKGPSRLTDCWRPRQAARQRLEPQAELVAEGRDALDWEDADAAELSMLDWQDSEELPCCLDLDGYDSDNASSLDETLSFSSWSIVSTAAEWDDVASPSSRPKSDQERQPAAASRWALGQLAAAEASEAYFKAFGAKKLVQEQKKKAPSAPAAPTPSPSPASAPPARLEEPPIGAGGPHNQALHDELLQYVANFRLQNQTSDQRVPRTSAEYEAVTEYFRSSLSISGCEVETLTRLNSPAVQGRFRPGGGQTIMFHGCRSRENEDKILREGFKVSACRSGGSGYGTWFAYGSHYSNSGFTFADNDGFSHLFICVVSYAYTVLDNYTMRVVGQDCAYPQWLIKYKCPRTGNRAIAPSKQQGPVKAWYVVRDGQWVFQTGAT